MRDRIIRIEWSSPLLMEDAIPSSLALGPGLYYITRLFGKKETSLYIGKATRSIREPICVHDRQWAHDYRGKIYARISRVVYPQYADSEVLDHAESALIFEHGDILTDNTDKRNSYSYSQLYQVENTGDCFELSPRVRMHNH